LIAGALKTLTDTCDLVITTGGASVGQRDWVRPTIERDGSLVVWRVSVRPGKPFGCGLLNGTPVLVLPGNPGSALACSHAFVIPAVRKLTGACFEPRITSSQLAAPIHNGSDRTFLCPVRFCAEGVMPGLGSTSQSIAASVGIDGFVIVLPETELNAGERVTVELST
jgi:molybdopterin biosynthesis enzyme